MSQSVIIEIRAGTGGEEAALFAVSGLTGEGIAEWGKWVMDNLNKLRMQNSTE